MLAAGGLVTVLAIVAVVGLLPGVNRACPAIGYAYVGDVELAFPGKPASVAACFGDGCAPENVALRDGKWLAPQSPPSGPTG